MLDRASDEDHLLEVVLGKWTAEGPLSAGVRSGG
jgi:hypothetical protein